jgi:hypothetical protein
MKKSILLLTAIVGELAASSTGRAGNCEWRDHTGQLVWVQDHDCETEGTVNGNLPSGGHPPKQVQATQTMSQLPACPGRYVEEEGTRILFCMCTDGTDATFQSGQFFVQVRSRQTAVSLKALFSEFAAG